MPSVKKFFLFCAAGVVLLGTLLIVAGWFFVFVPGQVSGAELPFRIQDGSGVFAIAEALEEKGFISNRWLFVGYVAAKGWYNDLKAGVYLLSPAMSIGEIARKLEAGDTLKQTVTIVEGWNVRDIGWYLENRDLFTAEEFFELVGFPAADYSKPTEFPTPKDFSNRFEFLQDKPKNVGLEGYLFPDTYQLEYGSSLEALVEMMLENFDKKITQELQTEMKRQRKTIFEVITMASLIEKEVQMPRDRRLVSGILWKRLNAGIPLQVDATISYITGKKTTKISKEETQIDSPYNTYRYKGLPFGPIANPGLDSILAALYPEKSNFWYYLSTPRGETIFSRTLEEHNKAKAKYLR